MKKYKFIVLFSIGIIFIVSGLYLGGQKQINSLIPIEELEISDKNYSIGNTSTIESAKYLNVSINAAKIMIIERQREDVEIQCSNNSFSIDIEDQTITINQKIFVSNDDSPVILIKVPEGYCFQSVDMEVGAGKLIVDSLTTERLNAEVGAGELKISHLYVKEELNIECGIGNVVVGLDQSIDDFDYEVDCGMGNVTLGVNQYSGVAQNQSISHDKNYFMNIECGIGNVEIKEE